MALKEINRNTISVGRSCLVMCSKWRVWRGWDGRTDRQTDRQKDRREKIIEVLPVSLTAASNIFSQRTLSISITNRKILNYYYCRRNLRVEICALLGFYAANNRNSLPTFRDNLSVPSSAVKKSKKKAGYTLVNFLYRGRCGSVIGCQ